MHCLCIQVFTITAQILACSLANFYRQLADRHMNAMQQGARVNNLTVCYRKKIWMSVFHASVLLLTMNFVIVAEWIRRLL